MANIFSKFVESSILKELTRQAEEIAQRARDNASWSNRIPSAISVGVAREDAGNFYIDIKVDISKETGAPHAAAFEYGSGERKESGAGEKYQIPSDDNITWKMSKYGNLYVLAFPISRWPNYVPPPNVNVAMFPGSISAKPYVMHPGVHAKPFLKPAIDATRTSIGGILLKAISGAFRSAVPKVTIIETKK